MNGNTYIEVTSAHRNEFLRVESALRAYGMDPTKFTIQEADLRLEQLLSPIRDNYTFNLYETPGADRPQETRLNRNDMFFVRGLAVCVYKQDDTQDPAQYGNSPLFTYPDPNFFNGTLAGSVDEWASLELIWNGSTSFLTDPVTRIQKFLNFNCRYAPERAFMETAYNYAAGPPTNPTFPGYGPTDEQRGFFMFSYMPAIYGNMNNRAQIELGVGDRGTIDGATDAAGEAVTTRNVLALLLKGYKVLNGAEAAGRWTAL